MFRKWEDWEVEYLKENHKKLSNIDMGEFLSRTKQSIRTKCNKLGLGTYTTTNKRSLEEDTKFIKDNPDMPLVDICISLKKGAKYIRNIRSSLGLKTVILKNSSKKWTDDEILILRENYGKIQNEEIAAKLNRGIYSIIAKARQIGISHMSNKYTMTKEDLIQLYSNEKQSATYIAKLYGITTDDVYTILGKYNIQIRGRSEIYTGMIGDKNVNWKGCGEIPGIILTNIKCRAINSNIEFNLTIEYLWELFLKQDKKCALTGLVIGFMKSKRNLSSKTASLDRIDSSKGYIEGNVQWVHKDINKMKFDLNQDKFIELCELVTKYKDNK